MKGIGIGPTGGRALSRMQGTKVTRFTVIAIS